MSIHSQPRSDEEKVKVLRVFGEDGGSVRGVLLVSGVLASWAGDRVVEQVNSDQSNIYGVMNYEVEGLVFRRRCWWMEFLVSMVQSVVSMRLIKRAKN